MKIIFFVALLLLSLRCAAEDLQAALNRVEAEWATIYYDTPKGQQASAYAKLLDKATELSGQYPKDPAALFLQALVKASYADHQDPVSALEAIYGVRDLLGKVIAINPNTMNGSAYVVLGVLYHKAPPWPIAFGDNEKAGQLLQTALKISPNGIDSNYYYGDFLLANNQLEEAEIYFERASNAPVRPEQRYADSQLQNEAKLALKTTRQRNSSATGSTSLTLLDSRTQDILDGASTTQ
ncbi:MAG: tetratricopeptide repeat protein [Methylovulum sp.]|nr:tetratricopeptide repeat protein [Methylovulum sp.]